MTVLLYAPRPVEVRVDGRERPVAAGGAAVETVREEWLVEDRWWTPEPIRRHYFELALPTGAARCLSRREGLVRAAGMSTRAHRTSRLGRYSPLRGTFGGARR